MTVDGAGSGEPVRIDSWIWAVRLARTRTAAAALCKAGHVKLNGERIKPAQSVKVGDRVAVRTDGWDRVVDVAKLIRKRVGPPVAVECYVDHTPPRPPKELLVAPAARDRGAGRPTKRDRRELDRFRLK
jgi:ribosome-associated heat shock protein Hsp15